jgi:hypothetical protein
LGSAAVEVADAGLRGGAPDRARSGLDARDCCSESGALFAMAIAVGYGFAYLLLEVI